VSPFCVAHPWPGMLQNPQGQVVAVHVSSFLQLICGAAQLAPLSLCAVALERVALRRPSSSRVSGLGICGRRRESHVSRRRFQAVNASTLGEPERTKPIHLGASSKFLPAEAIFQHICYDPKHSWPARQKSCRRLTDRREGRECFSLYCIGYRMNRIKIQYGELGSGLQGAVRE
jgi:hypothetical protein